MGYLDVSYLSNPNNARSQTGYVFLYGGSAISWRSVKQTMVATSSNHFEILALHDSSREYIWLMSMIGIFVILAKYPQLMKFLLCYLKIMQLVLHKLRVDISRVTEQSIFHQSSFMLMNSRRMVK